MLTKCLGGTGGLDFSVEKKHGPVADTERLGHMVVGEHHSHARFGSLAQKSAEPLGAGRVDARERLVADERPRTRQKRARELEPPALPS